MSGTIPLSMTQQFDVLGQPLAGGQLYLIAAGTVSTPQNGFQDPALVTPLPNPITLDAAGRVPQFFLADGYIKIRLQDKHGVVQLASDNVLVIGPSSGGGGGGATIDATTVAQTGDMKARYSTGVHPGTSPGWVRANGLTIGSAASSPAATERGNADCQALFTLLWGADATLVVSSGRGASAAADWAANKTIATPDMRSRLLMGLADMGNANNNVLAAVPFSKGNAITLGSLFGSTAHTQTLAEMMGHRHQMYLDDPSHGHAGRASGLGLVALPAGTSGAFTGSISTTNAITIDANYTGITISDGAGNPNYTTPSGSGTPTPMDITNPATLITFYLKL